MKIRIGFTNYQRKILLAELTKYYKVACLLNKEDKDNQLMFNYTEDVLDGVDRNSDIDEILSCIAYSGMKLRK